MEEARDSGGRLPENVVRMPGAYVAPSAIIESDVYIGPNAVVMGNGEESGEKTIIRQGSEIGANATVLPGVTIGFRARVAPGAVVTRSVPPMAIVDGNPARITGYVESRVGGPDMAFQPQSGKVGVQECGVKGVTFHTMRLVPDLRGHLSAGEFEKEIPFLPKRYFLVFNVPTAETRGEHAHLHCKQFLVAARGSVNVVVDDGRTREEIVLDRPHFGLYLPPMVWATQYRYSEDAMLLVFASEYYDPTDYVRDYMEYLRLVGWHRENQ
ncbi:MAG: WxcM-like domain-containing protein [Syntrophobacter sp.]